MTFLARRDVSTLQDRVNRMFREAFGPERSDEALTPGNFAPAVDVYEDEQYVTLTVEVPGMDENDIQISIENNTLTIRGERKFENEVKEENFQRIERMYGTFSRSFTLPNSVDPDQADARYEKGLLRVRLTKKAEAKPRMIKVNGENMLEAKGKMDGKGTKKVA